MDALLSHTACIVLPEKALCATVIVLFASMFAVHYGISAIVSLTMASENTQISGRRLMPLSAK